MRLMKKYMCFFVLLFCALSVLADSDFAFAPFEKEKIKSDIEYYWKHKKPHKKPPPPLNKEELQAIKQGITTYNAHKHWERRCKDAQEAPPYEWQKFLRKWHKKQRKLFFMAQNGDLHRGAANDFYLFGTYAPHDWENFRHTCHLGMPEFLKEKLPTLEK